jgi:CheY-like chemotaxis protein
LEQFVVPFFLLASHVHSGARGQNAEVIDEIRNRRFTILVIDDDPSFRKSFCFRLRRKYSAEVEDFDSGSKAVDAVRSGKSYDLIITDIMMPGMTGTETYEELLKINPRLRIVMMSAYSDSNEWKKAQDLGVTLLHKPIPEVHLIKVLSDLDREKV